MAPVEQMPADAPASNGVRIGLDRIIEIATVVNKIGLPLILLGLGVATYYGWIRSPLSELPRALERHDARAVEISTERLRMDEKVLEMLSAISKEMLRTNIAHRIQTCADITDARVRRRCLDQ